MSKPIIIGGVLGGIVLVAWTAVDRSMWNWYGFPPGYTARQLIDQFGGTVFAGMVPAWRIKPVAAA